MRCMVCVCVCVCDGVGRAESWGAQVQVQVQVQVVVVIVIVIVIVIVASSDDDDDDDDDNGGGAGGGAGRRLLSVWQHPVLAIREDKVSRCDAKSTIRFHSTPLHSAFLCAQLEHQPRPHLRPWLLHVRCQLLQLAETEDHVR